MRKLGTARGGVDWHRHRADPAAAEVHLEEFGTVAADDRDTVAALDAGGCQGAAEAGGGVEGLREAPGLVADFDQAAVAVERCLAA